MKPFGYKYNEAFWLHKHYYKNYKSPYGRDSQNVTKQIKSGG